MVQQWKCQFLWLTFVVITWIMHTIVMLKIRVKLEHPNKSSGRVNICNEVLVLCMCAAMMEISNAFLLLFVQTAGKPPLHEAGWLIKLFNYPSSPIFLVMSMNLGLVCDFTKVVPNFTKKLYLPKCSKWGGARLQKKKKCQKELNYLQHTLVALQDAICSKHIASCVLFNACTMSPAKLSHLYKG